MRALRELDTCRTGLVRMRIETKNRLETATAVTRACHAGVLAAIEAQRVGPGAAEAALVAADAALSGRLALLRSARGSAR